METNIISKSGTIDSKTLFRMMNGKCEKLRDCAGDTVDIIGHAVIDQPNTDGELKTILYMMFSDGRICASNSPTVRRTFDAMVIAFGEPTESNPLKNVLIVEAKSKNGRTFLDLDFA